MSLVARFLLEWKKCACTDEFIDFGIMFNIKSIIVPHLPALISYVSLQVAL